MLAANSLLGLVLGFPPSYPPHMVMSKAKPSATKIDVAFEGRVWDWPLQRDDGVVHVHNDEEKFQVGLEVRYFTPREIDVKVCGMDLVIQCQHEERSETLGTVRREIHRTYHLPPDVDLSTLKSHLTPKGILSIAANKVPRP